jgi:hypothetical protein
MTATWGRIVGDAHFMSEALPLTSQAASVSGVSAGQARGQRLRLSHAGRLITDPSSNPTGSEWSLCLYS